MRKLGGLVVLGAIAAGCGGSHVSGHRLPPITGKESSAVINDWLDDGRVDGHHSCGAVVEAVAKISALAHSRAEHPSLAYHRAISAFDRYAGDVCPSKPQLGKIVVGMTDAEVARIAGMPRTPRLRCWLYAVTRDRDGRRVCFSDGRVALVQVSVHF
jgi:hypothetical protein